jgi:hypothetical protein
MTDTNKKEDQNTDNSIINIMKENIDKSANENTVIIKNRGTGAGGAQTNKNGLSFEYHTSLMGLIKIEQYFYTQSKPNSKAKKKPKPYKLITFNSYDKLLIMAHQSGFNMYMRDKKLINKDIDVMHGCSKPDESYIDEDKKVIIIIEKKLQTTSGSVCEKIQTAPAKLYNYTERFPGYIVNYIYCLSDWYKSNCKAELKYLKQAKIPVFWGDDADYKEKIIKYIHKCCE